MPPLNAPSPALVQKFADIAGHEHALVEPDAQARFVTEWRERYTGKTPVVLRPAATEQVSQILALANEHGVGIVPQAGNTGLVGGQIPSEDGSQIVLCVDRMTRLRSADPHGTSMIVEAGMTLSSVQAAADERDRLFPLSMASEGSCCIGGNLATNAGGVGVLAYGTARHLTLGVEVVLPDGRIWDGLKTLEKDNTGYDLKDLFIGSEGTLGVITAAALRLFPKPVEHATAVVALPSLEAALSLLDLANQHAGAQLTAFEFMCALSLDMVVRHIPGTRMPFTSAHPWYVLLELSSPQADGRCAETVESLLSVASGDGIISDAAIAQSQRQRQDLWRLRETISEAQKPEGGSIKHDISVPIPRVPEFIQRASVAVEKLCPGARPVPFGHLGDGNIHYNVTQPAGMDKAQYLALWEPMNRAVHDIVVALGGSISAEHGIGRMKRDELRRLKSPVELDIQRRIKTALDPKGIMNPGKVL